MASNGKKGHPRLLNSICISLLFTILPAGVPDEVGSQPPTTNQKRHYITKITLEFYRLVAWAYT